MPPVRAELFLAKALPGLRKYCLRIERGDLALSNPKYASMSHSDSSHDATPAKEHWFNTTHWSVVLAAGTGSSPNAHEALEKLCRTYWYPLYAYVRRKGHDADTARDLTQGFFAHFLAKDYLQRADPQRGKFRTFLLTSLKSFLAHEWERARAARRGGGEIHVSWDQSSAEDRYKVEPATDLTPDRVFEQRWALTLFQQALIRLRDECIADGKDELFARLKAFLSDDPAPGAYAEAADALKMNSGAVAVAVHRLRLRYGELVREEIAHTVASHAEVQEELRYLIGLIGR